MPSFLRAHLGARRLLSAWACFVYLFLYVPIVLVVVYAFNKNRDVGLWTGFTTHWFGDALGDSQYTSALETSAKIALLSSLFATILGTAAALALARMRKAARAPFDVARLPHARRSRDRDRGRLADLLRPGAPARRAADPRRSDGSRSCSPTWCSASRSSR